MSIVDRISKLAVAKGMSISALERAAKLGNGTIGKWRRQNPSCENLKSVADCLNTTTDYLISGKVNTLTFSDDILQLIDSYNRIDSDGQELVKAQAKMLAVLTQRAFTNKEAPHEEIFPTVVIPLYDSTVSAGTGLDIDYATAEDYEVHEDIEDADFAVRVSGDSMEPRFKSGDIVLVHSAPSVEVGQIGIFILNGQAFIKELGNGELISLNSKYEPIKVKKEDSIYCQGRVIKVLSAKV